MACALLLLLWMGCRRETEGVALRVSPEEEAVFADYVSLVGDERLTLESTRHPERGLSRWADAVGVVLDLDCEGCYQVERPGDGVLVHAGDVLGAQYGVAAVLEQVGYRFHHPYETYLPAELDLGVVVADADIVLPQQSVRGLQPHTLHPIEALFDLWVPSDEDQDGARRIIDWLVKNRGDHLQYPSLDDILAAGTYAPWLAHTQSLVDYAHARGVRVGVGVQLFGSGNLQLAYDLAEEPDDPDALAATMRPRLETLLGEVPWDVVNLSFGEFTGEDPEDFVESCDLAYALMQEVSPGVEVTTIIHVGNDPELRVDYGGEEDILYYFLVKFADPAMVPYVHTTMYYNLFEDAGLAYEHEEFDEHRAYLLERLAAGERVAYFPESAYWVAFDINVPTALPLYWRSRWTDFDGIDQASEAQGGAPLDEHILFSSGWEWGYWATDVLTLRQGHQGFASWEDGFRWLWAPWGADGERLAEAQIALAELEHDALIDARLAPWLAGREQIIDLGDALGIHSQPDRPDLDEIAAYDAESAVAFQAEVVEPLAALGEQIKLLDEALEGVTEDRWTREQRDGLAVTALRARFAAAITGGALDLGAEGDASAALAEAESALTEAAEVVARRHGDLHDPRGERLIVEIENPTIYDFGYLLRAEELCFWERELAQLRALAGQEVSIPGCAL